METERLILRNRSRELIAEMLQQSKSEQLNFFGFETLEELEEKLVRIELGLAKENVDYFIFDLIRKDSLEVIGSCGFHNWMKAHDRTEIGYALHDRFQKKGYMREALQATLAFGFNEINLNRIEAQIEPDNLESIRLMEHFGFLKEGVLRGHYKGETGYEDSVIYSLLKSDFIK